MFLEPTNAVAVVIIVAIADVVDNVVVLANFIMLFSINPL